MSAKPGRLGLYTRIAAPLEQFIKHAQRRVCCTNISPACAHSSACACEIPYVHARLCRIRTSLSASWYA
eukprot:6193136-Pleurochrysis_carterae.AAC.2